MGVASVDPVARAAEVATFPTLAAERRFAIEPTDYGIGWVRAEQPLPGPAAGWLGPLVDFTMGRAVQGSLVPDVGIRTAGIRLDLAAATMPEGATVSARGEVVAIDDSSVLATVLVTDAHGALVATGSGRYVVVEGTIDPVAPVGEVPEWQSCSLAERLGIESEFGEPGRFRGTTLPWMANPYGIVHGGLSIAMSDVAIAAVGAEIEGSVRMLDLTVAFHRPLLIGVEQVQIEGRLDRVGRRVVGASALLFQGDRERPAATASATLLRG